MDKDWFKKLFINDVKSVLGHCECTDGGGRITEISTSDAMDRLLENATAADVGEAYLYVGETTDNYEHDCVYIIKEN